MNERRRLPLVVRTLIACVALAAIGTAAAAAEERVHFNIGAQDLLTALNEFAQQSDQELLFSSEVAVAKRTAGVTGEFLPSEALRTLLEGTGLEYRVTSENTILIERAGEGATDRRAEKTSSVFRAPLALAQATPASQLAQQNTTSNEKRSPAASEEPKEGRLGQMTVTGTHLRGAVETASPLFVFDQEDFDKAGAATPQQFLATLPQNFGGGHSDDTGNEPGLQFDASFGSAVNLRGLGSSSTLVLVNGHRWAAAGRAEFTDVSMIPLSAVERIEVLTDGASATYGSDAIGGVVNIILRRDYEGADTQLRYGDTTQGGAEEFQAAQSVGTRWSSGGVLLNYEYYRHGSLNALERDFSANAPGPYDLVPSQKRQGAYLSARQDVLGRAEIFGDAQYAERQADVLNYDPFTPETVRGVADTQQFGGSLGLAVDLWNSWQVDVVGGLSRNETDLFITSPSNFGGLGVLFNLSEYRLGYTDAKLTGSLFRLPGGNATLAVGGSYRDESYVFSDNFRGRLPQTSFNSRAAFAELLVPVVGAADASPEIARLVLTLAGRYEEHNAFGTAFDPKFGLQWVATEALKARATYGTSFKAPSLWQLNEFNAVNILATRPDSGSPTGATRAIYTQGNNASLHEETATTWTVGLEFSPMSRAGLSAEVTYFDIDYEGRILAPTFISSEVSLNDPTFAGLRIRRGDISDADFDAQVAELLSGRVRVSGCPAAFRNPTSGACSEPVTNINAIVDLRLNNLAGTRTTGIDANVNQAITGSVGRFDFGLAATYLFDYQQQLTEVAPEVEFVDSARNPVDLRLRSNVTWSRNGWGVTGTVNYTDGYTDNVGSPPSRVSSWTTLDLQVTYDAADPFKKPWLEGIVLSLTALNVLDEDPPFFANQSVGLGYDPSNADPLGRVISLTVRKTW